MRRRRGLRGVGLWALAAMLAETATGAAPVRAGPPVADATLAPARKALVARLEALASWCDGNRLAGERDRTLRRILGLDPEHVRARSVLRFKRADKNAPWVQAGDYTEPADWSKDRLGEAKKRRVEAAAAFRTAAAAAYDAAGVAPADGRREEAVEVALDVAPDDDEWRRQLGHVEERGGWVLPETRDARARRAEFARFVAEAAKGIEVSPDPKAIEGEWTSGAKSGRFVCWGDGVSEKECTEEVRLRELTAAFATEFFGPLAFAPEPKTMLLFSKYARARDYLESVPEFARLLKDSELVGGMFLPDDSFMLWYEDPGLRRVTGPGRVVISHLTNVLRVKMRAWVVEGVRQRVLRHVVGRHGMGCCTIQNTDRPTVKDEVAFPVALEDEREWLPHASSVLERDPAAKVRAILTMNLNAMGRAEALVAYALAAYLLEGRPDGLESLAVASGKIDDADAACKQALGIDAATLAWRVRRWVREVGRD